MVNSLLNGIIGNVLDPTKFIQMGLNIRDKPLKAFVDFIHETPKVYNVSQDKNIFLVSILGGQDPDVLKLIGIDAGLY